MNLQIDSMSFGELLSSMDIYDKSLCDLEFEQDQPKSAVAIIVKKSQQKNTQGLSSINDQILLLQRKVSPKDRFSGEICFPGGRQQPKETLLNTAIRQTFQETNILLTQQNLIGCINRQVNFIISSKKQLQSKQPAVIKKPQKQMIIYSFVFYVQSEFIEAQQIKLNHDEMETYQWVKAQEIANPRNICFFDYTQKMSGLAKVYQRHPGIKANQSSAFSCVSRALSPALDVKMNQKMYGITFYIFLIMITNMMKKLEQIIVMAQSWPQGRQYELKQLYCNLKEIKTKSEAHVAFELKKPISEQFREFQTALLNGMYKMRPRL